MNGLSRRLAGLVAIVVFVATSVAPIPGVNEIGSKAPPTFVRPEPSPLKFVALKVFVDAL